MGNKNTSTFSSNSSVLIKVNGEDKTVPQNITILNLLNEFKINHQRVVVELNGNILKKDQLTTITVKKDDSLEIVTFVGGG